jgi:phage gp37-like protein
MPSAIRIRTIGGFVVLTTDRRHAQVVFRITLSLQRIVLASAHMLAAHRQLLQRIQTGYNLKNKTKEARKNKCQQKKILSQTT